MTKKPPYQSSLIERKKVSPLMFFISIFWTSTIIATIFYFFPVIKCSNTNGYYSLSLMSCVLHVCLAEHPSPIHEANYSKSLISRLIISNSINFYQSKGHLLHDQASVEALSSGLCCSAAMTTIKQLHKVHVSTVYVGSSSSIFSRRLHKNGSR